MDNNGLDSVDELRKPESQESRFKEYLALFLRGKWIILGCVAAMVGAMVAYTLETKPVYQASSMVLLAQRSAASKMPFTPAADASSSSRILNELGVLKTRTTAEAVAQAILRDPFTDPEKKRLLPMLEGLTDGERAPTELGLQTLTTRVRNSVEFTPERESEIIRISAKSGNPVEAAVIANAYADVYQDMTITASRSRTRSMREFLESRMKEQGQALSKAETSLKSFMESSGMVSLDGESNQVVAEISQLEANRNAATIEIESLTKKLSSLQLEFPQQESSIANTISQANDPYIRMLQEQLAKLEVQRDIILSQNDPAVLQQEMYRNKLKDLDSQVAGLRAKLQKRSNDFIQSFLPGETAGAQTDPIGYLRTMKQKMLETKFDIEALKSKRDALNATIQTYDRRFRAIPRQSLEFARLQRERLSNEKLYTMVEEKYNETAISEKSEFGYVDVIDRAIVPGAPTGPNATRNLLMGLLLGLGLGVGIVVMRDVLDVRVRTPEQLKRRGYPPLSEVATMQGELSQLEKSGKVPREVRRFDKRLWLIFNPLSFLAESYRRLRTNLLRVQIERPLQALLVTSPNPGEGKSTTIANLAVAFAESNRRVLLIDADLRRPTVHTAFGLPVRPGLTDVLQKKATFEEAVQRSVVENLDVLCCGTISRNPSRFFGSVEMRELVEHARKNYGWVLIDAPPILVVNDGAVLSALVDGTILTLAAGLTRFAALERASEFLESAGGHFLGVVLNMFDARKAYGSYYGGTRYGHYDKNNGYYSGVPGDSSTWTPSQTN